MRVPAILLGAVLLSSLSAFSYAQAPVPFVNLPLLPDAMPPGGAQFTLTVNGTGFVSSSVVDWNGSPLATQFVSSSQLTATVPAANVAAKTTAWVTVVTPAPGGGTSNTAFFTVARSTATAAFSLASTLSGVELPTSVAVGDFNGDGKLDLAVTNLETEYGHPTTVSVFLGDGAGNFTLVSSPTVGDYAESVAVGDFNNDGKLDLAVAGSTVAGWNGVSILLGDGTGNFTLASSPAAGDDPAAVAVGDFNGDGNLDLAVANWGGTTVSILLGDGTGNFTLASSPTVGDGPVSVAVGDFNRDGNLDLAVTNRASGNDLSILLGDGKGNFTLASSPATGRLPDSVAAGDFNGDGILDLAVANYYDGGTILLGEGNGKFTLSSSPAAGQGESVAVGDFNGDGRLDLAVADGGGTVRILLGDRKGNFKLASSPAAGTEDDSVAVGDFNGDGVLDLAVANYYGGTSHFGSVLILLGVPGPGATLSPTSLNFGTQVEGTTSSQSVTLTSSGRAALKITDIGGLTNNANFSQTNNCPSILAINEQCTINVTFTADKLDLQGTLRIEDDAPTSPQTVQLTGSPTLVSLSPTSLNFGDQLEGTTSQPQTVTLTNHGSRAVSIFGVRTSGHRFPQTNTCAGTSVPPKGSCTISVTFSPDALGVRNATLIIGDNGGSSPQTVTLTGRGT